MTGQYACTCQAGYHTPDKTARRKWGCDEPAANPVFPDPISGGFHESKIFNLRRCPAGQVGPEWDFVVSTWGAFAGRDSLGPLPVAGGWLDQTQWFADVHTILLSERAKYHDLLDKKREAERKMRSPRGR